MPNKESKILVTTALPYANGDIHLGNLVGYIQTDIWVRFQKLLGMDAIFICGDDTHGTPIMISAEKQGITPEALIAKVEVQHRADFRDFHVEFDFYYTTHSPENQYFSNLIYQRLWDRGDIETHTIAQAYDPVREIFLPDRYVKGECPRCGAKDQYGDNCEVCGATYSPMDLMNPVSILSGVTPIQKESVHYFFRLQNYTVLQQWVRKGHLQEQVVNKLAEWFKVGLKSWDISRDAPYFGFEIPNAPGKYFYVWLDAPIGYMASFKKLCETRKDLSFEDYWGKDSQVELYHFVGKDIIYFHGLFWPAMLEGSGFLTVNGQKMSKSRGTFVTARNYLNHLNPEYLRYYFAAKLNNRVEDIDLNFTDFVQRINADLVGKVVNIASRCAGFITRLFAGKLAATLDEQLLFADFVQAGDKIAQLYQSREYFQVVREIMALADKANQYIDSVKPWVLAKQPESAAQVQACATLGLNLFRVLIIYLKPILPQTAIATESFLNIAPLTWADRNTPLLDHTIQPFTPLLQRVDPAAIEAMLGDG
jgi:methionyl-tRNA synthetase